MELLVLLWILKRFKMNVFKYLYYQFRYNISDWDLQHQDLWKRSIDEGKLIYFRGYYVSGATKGLIRKMKLVIKESKGISPANEWTCLWVIKFDGKFYRDILVSLCICAYPKCKNDCLYCERLASLMNI